MTPLEWTLLGVLITTLTAAVISFRAGDARRARLPDGSPRYQTSIGEAIRRAAITDRVLVLFVDDTADGAEADEALRRDEDLVRALFQLPATQVVVLREKDHGADILDHLFEKYGRGTRGDGALGLLLDGQGQRLEGKSLSGRGPLRDWLPQWVSPTTRELGPAQAPPGDGDSPVAEK